MKKLLLNQKKNVILIDNDLGLELKANRLEIYSKYVSENSSIPQIQGKFSFEFVEKTKITLLEDNVFIDKYVNLIYVKSDGYLYLSDDNSKVYYSRNYENSNGWIQLTNGKFIISLYGKYQPNLTIISKKRYNNLPEEFSPKFVEDLIFDITDLIFQTGKQAIKRAELWNKAKRSIEKIDFPEQCDWEFLLSIMIIRFKIKHSVELYVRWLKFIKVSLDEDQFFNNELSDSISLKNLLENKIF